MGPSSLARRAACPGSYRMEKDLPEQTNEFAEAGTAKHGQTAAGIRGEKIVAKLADVPEVGACIAMAQKQIEAMPGAEMLVEVELDLTEIHALMEVGTLDFALAIPFGKGFLVDWKFGRTPPSRADRNPQPMAYAIKLMLQYQLTEVTVGVVCPVLEIESFHTFTAEELTGAMGILQDVITTSAAPWSPCIPSDDACKYCKASETCPALLAKVARLPVTTDPNDLAASELGAMLDFASVVAKWAGKVKQRAMSVAMSGGELPGYELGTSAPRRVWRPEVNIDKLKALAKKLGFKVGDVTIKTAPKMATLPALEKKWGKAKKVRDAFKGLFESRPGSPKLIKTKEA
ncbi:MAG: DUF2800 domain-containing protein [Alphaproteobacteria bacterium]